MLKKFFYGSLLALFVSFTYSIEPSIPLQVWINQAIINNYTFNENNLLERQTDMAKNFMPKAWELYLAKLNDSNIIKKVKENHYVVSAVATQPPQITPNPDGKSWKAHMPILVKYQAKEISQTQNLDIFLDIVKNDDQNSEGFAILQYTEKVLDKPCLCEQAYYPKVTIA